MTVRDLVRDYQREVLHGSLTPTRVGEIAAELSALLGNISEEIREADVEFNQVLLQAMREEKAANRARVRAETTPEYVRKREARDFHEVAVEMIRSLRRLQDTLKSEMQLTR